MTQRGYYTLPNGQKLHFSANCWYNLLEDTGMQADKFGNKLQAEFDKSNPDILKTLNLLTDLAFAAAKAYNQEEGIDINFTRFKIRDVMAQLKEEDSVAFVKAMTGAGEVNTLGN